jgi:carbohydrate diacid regulator
VPPLRTAAIHREVAGRLVRGPKAFLRKCVSVPAAESAWSSAATPNIVRMGSVKSSPDDAASYITAELAQRVVDQVIPSLTYNVNVMDARGRIIGSADKARVGTIHAGAKEALRRNKPVVIHRGEESPGTKPGVNIPLYLDDRAVGVVGITGDPDEVETTAKVLVLTIELLIRQAQHRDDLRWREAAIRDVMSGLANATMTEPRLLTMLHDVGSPLRPPWNITAAITTHRGKARSPTHSARLLRHLYGMANVVAAEYRGAVWILQGSSTDRGVAILLRGLGSMDARFVVGRAEATTEQLSLDAQRLRVLLPRPELLPDRKEVRLSTLQAELAVAFQPPDVSEDVAGQILALLSPKLTETAGTFLSQDLSISHTSVELGMHRNTLVQRLDRIEALTGLNLRRFDDAVAMRLAILAARTR